MERTGAATGRGADVRFLVTGESRRLARWLRLYGYDTVLSASQPLSVLYRQAYMEGRVVVTRNHRVQASCLFRVVHLKHQDVVGQIRQLREVVPLALDERRAFTRCNICNRSLTPIGKAAVKDRVPPYVWRTQTTFYSCPSCQRIYWAATP